MAKSDAVNRERNIKVVLTLYKFSVTVVCGVLCTTSLYNIDERIFTAENQAALTLKQNPVEKAE